MKRSILVFLFGLLILPGCAQDVAARRNFNAFTSFRCRDCSEKYFISTNSGVLHTPLGVRVGFLGMKGAYLGGRFGNGTVYHAENNTTTDTKLFSVTAGLMLPIFIQNRFSIHTFFGGGYGQWFDKRWTTWAKSGVEVEGGLMVSYKHVALSFGGTVLDTERMYATGDATMGLGVRF